MKKKKQTSNPALLAARGVVKVLAIIVGLAATMIALMACIGRFTSSGWIRVLGALVIALAVPAVIADRLLPEDDPVRARGLPGDVFALGWLGFGLLFAVGLHSMTRSWLSDEGARLDKAGVGSVARVAYLLAGAERPHPAKAAPPRAASASAPASASAAKPTPASSAPEPLPSASASANEAGHDAGPVRPAPKKSGDRTPAELFKELAPAVVTIAVEEGHGQAGSGTGFVIDRRGTIVTNHHVIGGAKHVQVRFMGGSTFNDVELLADSPSDDVALIRVDPKKPSHGPPVDVDPVELGDSDSVVVGEHVIAIGNPLGLDHTLTDGLVSSRRLYQGKRWIQISVPISPGNSGGPLFDMRGKVVGITTAQFAGMFGRIQNLNLAIPVNTLKKLIQSNYSGARRFGSGAPSSHW